MLQQMSATDLSSSKEPHRVMTVPVMVYLLTAADVNLGLARQKAAVSSLLLTTVQGGFRLGGCQR